MLTIAALVPAVGLAISPADGGPVTLLPRVINAGAGDQYDPHVNGDLAAYTDATKIRFYRFSDGVDTQVPSTPTAQDLLSDVSNGKIVFSRVDLDGRIPVLVYDTVGGTTTEVSPVPAPLRYGSAIGSDTVAFIDYGLSSEGELLVSAIGGTATRVTTDVRFDQSPSVGPLGDAVVYESCATSPVNCDVRQAVKVGASWVVTSLTANAEPEANPDTDGLVVVYDATRGGERDLYWQALGGGAEQRLDLPGEQRNPSVSAGVLAFESVPVGDTVADLYVYHLATNRLFRVTNTAGVDETLNDVVVLPGGGVRVVWASNPATSFDRDVYGADFELPPVGPPTCTPRQVSLAATRNYQPSTWSDGVSSLSGFTFAVPAEVAVTEGNSGNKKVRLTFRLLGGDPVTCFYRGGTDVPHPTEPADVAAGQRYVFEHCTDGSVHAGSVVTADEVTLHVQGGDTQLARTSVALTLAELCPDAPAAPAATADHAGCSSTSGGFMTAALILALLALILPRRAPVPARSRPDRR